MHKYAACREVWRYNLPRKNVYGNDTFLADIGMASGHFELVLDKVMFYVSSLAALLYPSVMAWHTTEKSPCGFCQTIPMFMLVDAHTKWPEVIQMSATTSEKLIQF